HGERDRIDVDEHRARAGVADRRDGGDEGERHGDHFVAVADAGGEQREMQGAGAGVHGDAVIGGVERGELALEQLDFLAEDVLAAVEDLVNRGVDIRLNGAVLGFQIEERNHTVHLFNESSTGRPACFMDCVAASTIETTRSPAWPSAAGARRSFTAEMNSLSSVARASVSSSCGDHTSPVR